MARFMYYTFPCNCFCHGNGYDNYEYTFMESEAVLDE